jgi:predicted RNase H-like HicB family nuclease
MLGGRLAGIAHAVIIDTFIREMVDRIRSSKGVPMNLYTYTAVLHREEDLYVAECPEVGTVSQGYTIEEAMVNLREATELYLEEFPMPKVARPLITTFDVAVYA